MTEAAVVEAEPGLSNSPLVLVSFQKNAERKFKFLEGEPKALGITQVCLSVFQSSCMALFIAIGGDRTEIAMFFVVSSMIIIAGCVAIASKNLHLPTLKACVGMEIVATVASFFSLIILSGMEGFYCDEHEYDHNSTFSVGGRHCRQLETSCYHLLTELVVIQVTLLSISITLAVYACKVVNCCSTSPKVPVITIQAPPPAAQ